MSRRGSSLFVALLLMLAGQAACARSLVMTAPPPLTDIATYLQYWCDGDGQSTLNDVPLDRFVDLGAPVAAFGFRDDACWFRTRLENSGIDALSLWLTVDYPLLDDVWFFVRGEENSAETLKSWRLGSGYPPVDAPLQVKPYTVPLEISPGQKREVLIRVQTRGVMNVPVTIAGQVTAAEVYSRAGLVSGLLYGFSLGLLFYHIILWLTGPERTYRFFVLHVMLAIVFAASVQGVLQHYVLSQVVFPVILVPLFAMIGPAAGLQFTRDYLQTQRWPWLDRTLIALLCLDGLLMVIYLLTPSLHGSVVFAGVMVTAFIIVQLSAGIHAINEGNAAGKKFVVAWGVFFAAEILLAMNDNGLVAIAAGDAINVFLLGLIIQQLMVTFGMVERVRAFEIASQRKERERLQAELESAAKSEFLARMSHEIRTPMNAMLGLSDLLRGTDLDHTQRGYVDNLSRAGNSLLNVINDILDISKIEAGKMELHLQPFELEPLLDECLAIFRHDAEKKGVWLKSDWKNLPWVEGDEARLRQILFNLLSNAVKFTEKGKITFSARVVPQGPQMEPWLHCRISDEGVGISEEQQQGLFQSFQQADSSTSRKYGGSGLGLAISHQLATLMGGHIELQSTLGKGSDFTVILPLKLISEPVENQLQQKEEDLSGLRVLVVEDNTVNQMVARELLKKLGVSADIVSGGREALELLTQQHQDFDLVLMDCEMPDMDGYETTRQLRQWENSQDYPPMIIIALTAHALENFRRAALESGMDDHLGKPVTLESLREKLSAWVAKRGGY